MASVSLSVAEDPRNPASTMYTYGNDDCGETSHIDVSADTPDAIEMSPMDNGVIDVAPEVRR